jgi:hypothetical protein
MYSTLLHPVCIRSPPDVLCRCLSLLLCLHLPSRSKNHFFPPLLQIGLPLVPVCTPCLLWLLFGCRFCRQLRREIVSRYQIGLRWFRRCLRCSGSRSRRGCGCRQIKGWRCLRGISFNHSHFQPFVMTYSIQPPSTQHPFCCRSRISSIPLQVPCNISSTQLWEHLRYLVDLSRIYACCGSAGGRVRGRWLAEVPS